MDKGCTDNVLARFGDPHTGCLVVVVQLRGCQVSYSGLGEYQIRLLVVNVHHPGATARSTSGIAVGGQKGVLAAAAAAAKGSVQNHACGILGVKEA